MLEIFDHTEKGMTLYGLKVVYTLAGEVLISTDCALLGVTGSSIHIYDPKKSIIILRMRFDTGF